MSKIWKYTLEYTDSQTLDIPEGAEILTVQMQAKQIQIWAIVDPEAPKESITIHMITTGHEMPKMVKLDYIGTCQRGFELLHIFKEVTLTEQKKGKSIENNIS